MGALLIANKGIDIAHSLRIFKEKGFNCYTKVEVNNHIVYIYRKIFQDINNFYRFDNGDWIAVVGTFFYKNLFGIKGLKLYYKDFDGKQSGFDKLYKYGLGHYLIIMYKDHNLFIFNDFEGLLHTFISKKNNKVIMSTSFLSIIKSLKNPTISIHELYEYIFTTGFFGNKSIIKEIDLINCEKFYQVDYMGNLTIKNKDILNLYEINNSDIEEIVSNSVNTFSNYFSVIKDNFKNNIMCELTGGMDTRVLASLLKFNGVKPIFVHGKNEKKENNHDTIIANLIAKSEKIDIILLNWWKKRNINEYSEYANFIKNKYFYWDGLYLLIGEIAPELIDSYKNLGKLNCITIGGQGGNLHTINLQKDKYYYNIKNLFRLYLTKGIGIGYLPSKEIYDEYLEQNIEKIKGIVQTTHDSIINSDEINIFRHKFISQYLDGRYISFMNQFMLFLSPFLDTKIANFLLCIPAILRTNYRYQIKLLKILDTGYEIYPFFTHSRYIENISILDELNNKNIKESIENLLPQKFRMSLIRIKNRNNILPYHLSPEFLNHIFHDNSFMIKKYINIDNIKNVTFLQNAYNLELIIRKTGIVL